ncbi:MAG: hypothetical protein KJ956_14415, partial [Actinobacteria bacterium]|nr:hypothetical protein [Actinomycetota bacterium]
TNGGTLSSTGVVQLTSSGGTITISGANQLNATGGVDIDGGTLEFSAGASGVVSGGAGFALGGGTVNLNDGTLDVDSTFNQTAGTFNAGSGVFRLSADFDFDGGLFNADTSNTTFDSDATTTVSSAFGGFNDVNITGGTVNVSAGAVLIQDDLNLSTETQLNIGAGLFRVAGDTTINGSAGIEITTSGVDTRWNNVTIPATGTFEASDINATITFDGTSSFTVGDGDGQAATVTLTGAAGAGLSLRSSSNTWQLIDHVDDTNTLSIFNVIAFDADSSAGKSIFAGSGSLLVRTTNWHTVLDHFSIETISTPQTAGVPFDVQLVAEDIYDNTVTTFTGTVTINDTTGSLTPAISGAFLGGLRTQSVAVTVADTNTTADVTITVQDSGTDATGISNAFDMQAGSLDHFGVSTVPSTIVAGENFSVTITAQDADNNTVTGFNGTAVLSDETGTLTPTVTGSFGAGVVTQNDLAITLADSNTTADVRVTATRSGGTETGQSNLFDVQPNDLHHFAVGTITSPRIANESFDLELTAQDIHDNTVTDFTGTVTISDTTGTVTPTTSAAFTGGVLTQSVEVTEADPDTTADVKITVQDSGTGATGISNAFDVQAGSLDHFSLSIVPSTIVAGESFSVTITAEDADNNTVTGFTGTAVLTDDTGTLTPTVTDSFGAGVVTQSNLAITLADSNT